MKTRKILILFVLIAFNTFGQKITPPEQFNFCKDDPDNPFNPYTPQWVYAPFKIVTGCDQVKVGIGEAFPKYLLDVHKGTGRFKKVKTVKVEAGIHRDYGLAQSNYPGTGIINAYYPGTGSMLLDLGRTYTTSNGSTKVFTVKSDGAVRIYSQTGKPFIVYSSTGNKAVQIDNNGTLHARQIEVDLANWPDYVFENDYKLLSLEEVALYISRHKHLPNVPAAKTVEGKGLNLGKMQKIMMQKIEELTLYTIDQQVQIKQIKSENKQLKADLEALKKEVNAIKKVLLK